MDMTDLTDKQLLQATFEEVGAIKEDITELKSEMVEIKDQIAENQIEAENSREVMNEKLDKILTVVSEKFASHHKRISKIEDHLGFAILN